MVTKNQVQIEEGLYPGRARPGLGKHVPKTSAN